MKLKTKNLVIPFLLLIMVVGVVKGEFYTYGTSGQVYEDNATYYMYAWSLYDDEYEDFVGAGKTFDIAFRYSVNDLSVYNSAHPLHSVEWVNVTCFHQHNIWENGEILNDTILETTDYYTDADVGGSGGLRYVFAEMGNQDYFTCWAWIKYNDTSHYLPTSQGIMGGWRFRAPSYECSACSEYTYEQLVAMEQKEDDIHERALTVYDYVLGFVGMNYEILLIIFWIIRIGVVIGVISLFIFIVFWIYHQIRGLGH